MPQQQVVGRVAVVGAVLVGVLGLCGLTVRGLSKSVSPEVEVVDCKESDHRLAEHLAGDPVLTSPPPGTTLDRVEQFPCGDESDPWARYVTADIRLPPGASMDPVLYHYRTLLTAGHWRIAPDPGEWNLLCADRATNGQQVRLLLGYGRATPGPHTYGDVGIEISFEPGGEDLRCPS
ncbi:hypothetical protein [Micromonospora thermarum]|uniref:Septum formation-related domain-containing protein n=1 Tax=Micromonospora thermarum TaxID=2720024 RepID=A0ABX0Z3P3_9ACTN|nr:hypothetical protein [Micromonospora thermarum]NJP31803.1 hypothetical protein [Micromonospora thermarum]